MFLIFGTKRYVTVLGLVTFVCGRCGNPAAQRVEKWVTKFTLFFVPLFPVSTKYVVQCAMCGTHTRIERAEAERLTAGVPGAGRTTGPAAPEGVSGSDGRGTAG